MYINFVVSSSSDCRKELKVKSKAPLTEFLEMVKLTLSEYSREVASSDSVQYQLLHVRDILERWKIVGLNRKIQLKPRKFEEYQDESGIVKEIAFIFIRLPALFQHKPLVKVIIGLM